MPGWRLRRKTPGCSAAENLWCSPLLRESAALMERAERPPRKLFKPLLALAASLLLGLGLVLHADLPLRLRADHLTAVGERQELRLEDGSRVLLNTDSALVGHLEGRQRRVRLLRGEAYFDIVPENARPFEVEAGPMRVSVRGTAFAVRYLGDEAEISVARGEVDLRSRRGLDRVVLGAGDSIRVGPAGFGPRLSGMPSDRLAWVEGRLVFENCPFSEVLAELRRYYPGWIVNRDDSLSQRKVTGSYRLDDPAEALRALAESTSARLREYPALMVFD